MNAFEVLQTGHFSRVLARREQELCAVLATVEALATAGAPQHEVTDFKDMAADETAATLDGINAEHAAHELEQVLAARRRLHDGTYGVCEDCGDEIQPQRLEALPATPYCTACQADRERPQRAHRR